jgi:hypothetical protein
MTKRQLKILVALFSLASLAALLAAGKQAQCELGVPACSSSLLQDFARIDRAPFPPESLTAMMAAPIAALEDVIAVIGVTTPARRAR